MAKRLSPRLYHVHEPGLLQSVLAVAGDTPVIFDSHESYGDLVREEWTTLPKALRYVLASAWNWYERRLCKRCKAVITVTPEIAAKFEKYHARVVVVANYPPCTAQIRTASAAHSKTLVFAGGVCPGRGLHETIEAMATLQLKGIRLELQLAGPILSDNFADSLRQVAADRGISEQVKFLGKLTFEDVEKLYATALAGLSLNEPTWNSMNGLPRKMLEYMNAGLPVIASDFPTYRRVVGISESGLLVDPTSISAIADAFYMLASDHELAERLGRNGRRAIETEFNWGSERTKLLDLYQEILGGGILQANE